MMRGPIGLLLAATLLTLTGCGSGPKLSPDAPAPGLRLGVREAGDSLLSGERAYPSEPMIARYVRYEGGSARAARQRSEIRVTEDPLGWRVERWRLPTNAGKQPVLERRVLLNRGGDGSVLLIDSAGGDRALTTLFDPPARLAGGLMHAGEAIESEFRARVMEDPRTEAEAGEGSVRVEYAGRQPVETPMGTFDADLLVTSLDLDFGIVRIRRVQRQWIATVRPGRTAMVAEDIAESQTVLGFTRGETRLRLAIESIVR
jgi:hypothetical protein